jgi:HEAT repeat protein
VRKAAAEALGRLSEKSAVEPLTLLLTDPDHDVREAVVEALGQIHERSAITALVVALTDAQSSVRHVAAGVLRKIDPDWRRSEEAQRAVPALKSALASRDYWVRHCASDALKKLTAEPKEEVNSGNLAQPFERKRTMALQALLNSLGDWDRDIRLASAEALGRLSDQRAAAALESAVQDLDPWVRRGVELALRRTVGQLGREGRSEGATAEARF